MPVSKVLHIGDSVSKLGITSAIGAYLTANYPAIEYIASATNNNGVTNAWAGMWYTEFIRHDPQVFIVNTGMWDRLVETSSFEAAFPNAMRQYKGAHPKARVVWLSTTICATTLEDYEMYNARIISNNTFAVATLNTIYGVGGWDFVDQYQCAIDNSLAYSDDVHFTAGGYAILAANVTAVLGDTIDNYEEPTVMAAKTLAYGVCKTGPADFKTGSPTMSIVSGVATFSVAQTDFLMGVGAEIAYNDGEEKKCYVKPVGKISTSQWRVTTALGDAPADCAEASVSVIKHPFDGLSAAFAGHVGAAYLNSADRTEAGVNVELHLPCYKEQATYTKDTAAAFSQSSGDLTHLLKIYSPKDTFTQCNLTMKFNTAGYNSTKYSIEATSGTTVISKGTVACYIELFDIQIMHLATAAATTRSALSISPAVALDYMIVHNCIIAQNAPSSGATSEWRAIFIGVSGGGTYKIFNNLIIGVPRAGTNTGNGIKISVSGCNVYFYGNTVYGQFESPFERVAGKLWSSNNLFIGCTGASSAAGENTITKDYDTYDVDEEEVHGTLTTQADSDIFMDVTNASCLLWDFTLKSGSSAIDTGTALDSEYSGDLLNDTGWRPKRSGWDCGANELAAQSSGGAVGVSTAKKMVKIGIYI